MAEPCAVYSTRRTPFSPTEIRGWAAGATVTVDGPAEDWATITVEWPDCTVTIHSKPSGELPAHLDGFRGYIWHCGQKMTPVVYAVLQRTHLIRHVLGTVSTPSITETAAGFLRTMALAGCGLLFRANSVFNSDWGLLLGPERIAEDQQPDYWPDALERRKRTRNLLQSRGFPTPETLPPVAGEHEVVLRSPQDVGHRALALYAVAYRAVPNGIDRKEAKSLLAGNESALSLKEKAFLDSFFPSKEVRIQMSWRFESLWVLLWALGFVQELGLPERVVQVEAVEAILKQAGLETIPAATAIRPCVEVLDQLDLVYRCHWLITDARLQSKSPPEGLDAGVVSERHHALNWLTCFQNAEWDEVGTDT